MKLLVGETYLVKEHGRFQHPIRAEVEKVYENSVLAKIIATHIEDDDLVKESKGRMIISKKYLSEQIKTETAEEKKTMKFNLNTATLLLPGKFGAEGKECLSISKSGLALSGPIVQRLNKPEWVQLYIDEQNKAIFVLPCKPTDEGARCCANPKPKKKNGYRKSWSGSILEKVIEIGGFDISKYRYYFNPESVEGYPSAIGFDLNKPEKTVISTQASK